MKTGKIITIPCKTGLFFRVFLESEGKREASVERETHAIEEAERSSFSATQVPPEVAQARTDKHRRTSTLLHTRENLVAYRSKYKDLYGIKNLRK